MALVSAGLFFNTVLVDSGGNKSNMSFELNPAAAGFDTLANLGGTGSTRIAEIITNLEAITECTVLSYSIGEKFEEDTLQFGADEAEVERVASLVTTIDGTAKKHTLRIPSPVPAIFVGNGAAGPDRNNIDPTDGVLQTYLRHFQATINDTTPFTGGLLVSDGESIVDVSSTSFSGKQIHRGSRKG